MTTSDAELREGAVAVVTVVGGALLVGVDCSCRDNTGNNGCIKIVEVRGNTKGFLAIRRCFAGTGLVAA
ncbi:MAG: hypothetical protein M3N42_14755 [Cyanobacteriota bacterium]|nr:hypothetical protein [Cyanobacteriota bacterium]